MAYDKGMPSYKQVIVEKMSLDLSYFFKPKLSGHSQPESIFW
jgi:hypothetical protein